jgi:hypothetical protein
VNSSLLVAIPGNLANRRGIYESTDNAAFIVYMDGNPVTKHDTPEAAKLNAKRLADRFANHKIEVRQEQCTEKLLATITENLKWMMS